MANYKQQFMTYMDRQGIKYTDVSDYVVRVSYSGDNMETIATYIFFDEDGDDMVQVACSSIANFKDSMAAGLVACNTMNAKYRWVKFYLDKDCDLECTIDAYIDESTCGSECLRLVKRVVNIVDEAYPIFMKARWSN